MIISFIGNRGSGKTLSMTKEAFNRYKNGWTIYSNYKLNFPHTLITHKDILAYAENGIGFNKACILLDELHVYLDSRTPAKKRNRIFSLFITQSRKKNCDILYTTQFPRQVDVRMRIHTDMAVECRSKSVIYLNEKSKPMLKTNYMSNGNEFKVLTFIENKVIEFGYDHDKIVTRTFFANKFYDLYDTREVITLIDDEM